jgi:hypothetical protein
MIKLRGSFQKTPEIIRKAIAFVRVSGASRITASSVSCLSEQCKHPQTVMSGCPSRFGTQRQRTITRLQVRHRYGSRKVIADFLWWPQRSICRRFDDGGLAHMGKQKFDCNFASNQEVWRGTIRRRLADLRLPPNRNRRGQMAKESPPSG